MEMDLGSAIIGAIAIIICALPFVIMNREKKKREQIFFQSLSKIATQNNCQINQHEIIGNLAIGIDKAKNYIFYFRQLKDNEIEQYVDLSEIQSCKVINTSRTFKNKDDDQKVIDRLELILTPVSKNKTELKMEFFNADVNTQLYGELQSIEKWSKLINDQLKLKK